MTRYLSSPDRKLNTLALIEALHQNNAEEFMALMEDTPQKLGLQFMDMAFLAVTAFEMLAESQGMEPQVVIAAMRTNLIEAMTDGD